jgi:N utilization substance protein B
MLSRRHIRIKVMQALYSYSVDDDKGLSAAERNLKKSIEDIYRLFLHELKVLQVLHFLTEERLKLKSEKKLPSQEDLNPKTNFAENRFLLWLQNNHPLKSAWEKHHVSFGDSKEVVRAIFKNMLEDERYLNYLDQKETTLQEDKTLIKYLYATYVTRNESLHQVYEDYNLHWADDLDVAQMMVAKTIKKFNAESDENSGHPSLIRDKSDIEFALRLFRKTITHSQALEPLIKEKAKNWETERIAQIDFLIIKMALTELKEFNQIPIKVTLNEYIELAKQYSTPKSGNFVNGIVDKIKEEMLKSGEIRKIGRGLL